MAKETGKLTCGECFGTNIGWVTDAGSVRQMMVCLDCEAKRQEKLLKTPCGLETVSKEFYDKHIDEDCDYCYRAARR